MRFSFCKGLHIPFVKHLCNVTGACSCQQKSNSVLLGSHCCSLESTKKTRKIVIWGIKSRIFFWPAGAVSACGGSNAFFLISHDFAHTYSDSETLTLGQVRLKPELTAENIRAAVIRVFVLCGGGLDALRASFTPPRGTRARHACTLHRCVVGIGSALYLQNGSSDSRVSRNEHTL